MNGSLRLRHDPLPALIACGNTAIRFHALVLSGSSQQPGELWTCKDAQRILRRQQTDGSWHYQGKTRGTTQNYEMLETYRQVGFLVEKYAFDRIHPAMDRAAEYLLSLQTDEGDIRGIYGHQYMPNYMAAILELLIKAGYEDDQRVVRGMEWLLDHRQQDGGWALPLRTAGANFIHGALSELEPISLDATKPSSHLITGIVLRAFAAHPRYKQREGVLAAGRLLASRFFLSDRYPDRRAPSYWTSISFPFWNTDLLSSLDSLSQMGLGPSVPGVQRAIEWFVERQGPDGLWRLHFLRDRDKDVDLWIALAIARVFRRYRL